MHISTRHTYGAISDFFYEMVFHHFLSQVHGGYFHCNINVFTNMFKIFFVLIFSQSRQILFRTPRISENSTKDDYV